VAYNVCAEFETQYMQEPRSRIGLLGAPPPYGGILETENALRLVSHIGTSRESHDSDYRHSLGIFDRSP